MTNCNNHILLIITYFMDNRKEIQLLLEKIIGNIRNPKVAEKPHLMMTILKSLRNGSKYNNLQDIFDDYNIKNEYLNNSLSTTSYETVCGELKRSYFDKNSNLEKILCHKLDTNDYEVLLQKFKTRIDELCMTKNSMF